METNALDATLQTNAIIKLATTMAIEESKALNTTVRVSDRILEATALYRKLRQQVIQNL